MSKEKGRSPSLVEISQADYGVASDFPGKGKLRCLVCDRPYVEHAITECCLPYRRGAFTTKTKEDRWTPKEERTTRYKGIPQVRVTIRKEL